ncbi:hypothetical protein GUITHDRAFT_134376 [Guillardia theta CCMP2712]|uniref:Uncharacterized protein n=1 Tax=Guillardia theta (strain CCMP2712) TaxID=905079 RepID=L1JT14_GUITC|nr:hypothetical protein GUITHDRAFT_134376 [Guillardia theta CCMP2712]EKX51444.1 hypothetical protein GUITHDRAFT_134376 [Guillardia theta CCMP2712]|eukprot:XP_005838424.1 hypothetical protein GUITHDRAFT_134376 [Guillardia theta CCMP2712]
MAIIGESAPKIWAQERYFHKDVHHMQLKQHTPSKLHVRNGAEQHAVVKDEVSPKSSSHARSNGDFDDVENVQSLMTPRLAKTEQLWEEDLSERRYDREDRNCALR